MRRHSRWIVVGLVAVVTGMWLGPVASIAAIHGYQHTLGPMLERAGLRCRFTPSCSRYAETVIQRDGLLAGSWKAATRIVRCGPWTPMGTSDLP